MVGRPEKAVTLGTARDRLEGGITVAVELVGVTLEGERKEVPTFFFFMTVPLKRLSASISVI